MKQTTCLLIGLITLAVCAVAFPLAQMYCYGNTDYRREADVVVVFGCRVYKDGTPSDALKERVQTACRLYLEGYVETPQALRKVTSDDVYRLSAAVFGTGKRAEYVVRGGLNGG